MSAQARLLVVDDEEVVCRSCSRIFERVGFHVETSRNPREGLRLATSKNYNAILLDIMMPELSGIEFLQQLRAVKPSVPVIIITGYSSVTSAAEAMRLHAVDYVPKPFTPDEITAAVSRVVTYPAPGDAEPMEVQDTAAEAAPPRVVWKAVGKEFLFRGNAWMRLGADASVRAGAFLSRDEVSGVVSVRVAAVGDVVTRGLPLAEVTLNGGRKVVVPAPVGGEILEVNPALATAPGEALHDPCETGWLARIRPVETAEGLRATGVRRVYFAGRDDTSARRTRVWLEHLGCAVQTFADTRGVLSALVRAPGAVVMVDDESLGEDGVSLVRAVAAAAPQTKIVVIATGDSPHQVAYRTERVMYYATAPLANDEMIDILHSAFREVAVSAPRRRETTALEPSLRAIKVHTRQGKAVTLLTSGELLYADRGLGTAVLERLLAGAYPVETTIGVGELGMSDISRALGSSDRVLILWNRDTGRISGSLTRRPMLLDCQPGRAPTQAITLVVQPAGSGNAALDFEPGVIEALATAVVEEITTTP